VGLCIAQCAAWAVSAAYGHEGFGDVRGFCHDPWLSSSKNLKKRGYASVERRCKTINTNGDDDDTVQT